MRYRRKFYPIPLINVHLHATRYTRLRLTATANVRDTEAVEAAVELERKKNKTAAGRIIFKDNSLTQKLVGHVLTGEERLQKTIFNTCAA